MLRVYSKIMTFLAKFVISKYVYKNLVFCCDKVEHSFSQHTSRKIKKQTSSSGFDYHAGAGASSTSVGPSTANWLAEHRADLTLPSMPKPLLSFI